MFGSDDEVMFGSDDEVMFGSDDEVMLTYIIFYIICEYE